RGCSGGGFAFPTAARPRRRRRLEDRGMKEALLRPVDSDALDQYPIAEDEDLKGHRFVMFDHDRWLNSDTFLRMSAECGWFYLNLIFLSQKQRPIGTLPDDDELLASLLRIDLGRWKELRARQ